GRSREQMKAMRGGRRHLTLAAAMLSGVLALSACGGGGDSDSDDGKGGGGSSQQDADRAAEEANASEAEISIKPEQGATGVGINSGVQVSVKKGTLDEVELLDTETGTPVEGSMSDDQKEWTPAVQLERARQYELTVQASDSQGRKAHASRTFTTI